MELEQLAERFEMVRMTGRGFTCRCPAHDDRSPSLVVNRGTKAWVVTCWAGCGFNEIVAAAGLTSKDFFFNSLPSPRCKGLSVRCKGLSVNSIATAEKLDQTRDMMREMILESREIKWTFGQLMQIAFSLSDEEVGRTLAKYPEFRKVSLPEAMKMHAIMFAGPVADLIGDRYYPQYDQDARGRIGARLWQEYRTQQSSLA